MSIQLTGKTASLLAKLLDTIIFFTFHFHERVDDYDTTARGKPEFM